jgi:hypothetical protein
MTTAATPLFESPHLTISEKGWASLNRQALLPQTLLARHQRGDWGNVSEEQRRENITSPIRNPKNWKVVSCFGTGKDRIWIYTQRRKKLIYTVFLTAEEWEETIET